MPHLSRVPVWLIDISMAYLALMMARKGHIEMGKASLFLDDTAEPDERLPYRLRTRLAGAVGWQEGIRSLTCPQKTT